MLMLMLILMLMLMLMLTLMPVPFVTRVRCRGTGRSRNGTGHFNWRIAFGDLPLPQPLNSPCRLSLNVWDCDPLLATKELIGTAEVDMRKLLFRKAISRAAAAKHKGALSTKIRAMSTKHLRSQLRQLGEHYDSSSTRTELVTALE
jgi:hypothetical protein